MIMSEKEIGFRFDDKDQWIPNFDVYGRSFKGWAECSRKGEICGMLGCFTHPLLGCYRCKKHYCKEHLEMHYHPPPRTTTV